MKNKETKIVRIPLFTYDGVFGCIPTIQYLNFDVDVKKNKTESKNESFADEYVSVSKSSKNKKQKLK
jgi:hypothetical protein|tara:strand:+ start:4519 stop:4719 length:201 start_codon:yes stop_codon:yes gene_type:complete